MEEVKLTKVQIEATDSQLDALRVLGFNPVQVETIKHEDKADSLDSLISPILSDGAQEQAIEPENLDKFDINSMLPFVKAQVSTKNQMVIRNILAVVSSIAVVIAFILEKLGIL